MTKIPMRILNHPILDFAEKATVKFTYDGKQLEGKAGEPIISALRANDFIKTKQSTKDHKHPAGPYCMQGRCASCMMEVNGKPNIMTCVTPLKEGMIVKTQNIDLKADTEVYRKTPDKSFQIPEHLKENEHEEVDLAVIGGGPAGIEAALMASEAGVKKITVLDDKEYLGGQLALQTHTFFGNKELGAAERGYLLGEKMVDELKKKENVNIKLGNTVVGLFQDNIVCFRDIKNEKLSFLKAKKIIMATGASEKFLSFPGNYLPGVMGAGGAQTFMNIHGVKPGTKALIVGGGNIGVILAYQLLQAGIEVKALVEAQDHFGAYKVHVDKMKALGVPCYLKHSIVKALGKDKVEGAVIKDLETGKEEEFDVDLICLAVGLSPLTELLWQAGVDFKYVPEVGEAPVMDQYRSTSNKDIFAVGDCAVIGEASIARLEGRIAGLKASIDLGKAHPNFSTKMENAFKLLNNIQRGSFGGELGEGKAKLTGTNPPLQPKLKPYKQKLTKDDFKGKEKKIQIICCEDIPCNPCETSCPYGAIEIGKDIVQQPTVNLDKCIGCGACLIKCPGRAIRLIKYNENEKESLVTFPYEFNYKPKKGEVVTLLDEFGKELCKGTVTRTQNFKNKEKCNLVTCKVPKENVFDVKTMGVPVDTEECKLDNVNIPSDDNAYVCRCEEVTYKDINDLISKGYTTINDFKRVSRAGMGQCRGLSCKSIMEDILRRRGVSSRPSELEEKISRKSHSRVPIKRVTLGEAARMTFSKEELDYLNVLDNKVNLPREFQNMFIPQDYIPKKKMKKRVVIIGGGAQGIMTAYHLSQEKGFEDCIVLEKDFLTAGATGACLGGCRTGFATSNKVKRAVMGYETFKNAEKLIGKSVGFHKGGYVYASFTKEQDKLFEEFAPIWEKEGVPYEIINDKNKMGKYVPGVDNSKLTSIVWFPECGGVNPFAVVYGFAEAAESQGVAISTKTEVLDIDVENNKVKSVIAKKNNEIIEIECEYVINCAGSYCAKVGKMAGIDIGDQVWAERHGTLVTERIPYFMDPLLVSYHPTLSGYWQQKRMLKGEKVGEIIGCFSPNPVIKGYNTESQLSFMSRMAQSMLNVQPNFEDIGIVRHCAHHYVKRASGIPITGPTPVKGYYFNVAKAGHGLMCSAGDAFALAKTISSGKVHPWITECTIENSGEAEKFH